MRLIKGFIFAIAGLFIMITLLSLLIPSKVMVSRGVVINANPQKIYAEISILQNWKHWQPVFKSDSLKINFSPGSTGTNSFCEWESNGKKNKLIITDRVDNQISVALQREGENDVSITIVVVTLPDSNSVQVEWNALTRLKWYPWEKFYGIFIEKSSGQGYEDALNSLKAYVEAH